MSMGVPLLLLDHALIFFPSPRALSGTPSKILFTLVEIGRGLIFKSFTHQFKTVPTMICDVCMWHP